MTSLVIFIVKNYFVFFFFFCKFSCWYWLQYRFFPRLVGGQLNVKILRLFRYYFPRKYRFSIFRKTVVFLFAFDSTLLFVTTNTLSATWMQICVWSCHISNMITYMGSWATSGYASVLGMKNFFLPKILLYTKFKKKLQKIFCRNYWYTQCFL